MGAVAGTCGFWQTMGSYVCCCVACLAGPCCLTVYFRLKLKDRLGLQDRCCSDFCWAWMCCLCAIGQQVMDVDRRLGYEMIGCFDLAWDDIDRKLDIVDFETSDIEMQS